MAAESERGLVGRAEATTVATEEVTRVVEERMVVRVEATEEAMAAEAAAEVTTVMTAEAVTAVAATSVATTATMRS